MLQKSRKKNKTNKRKNIMSKFYNYYSSITVNFCKKL